MGFVTQDLFDLPGRRGVKQLLDLYRQKCISACLMYPTFRSSTVIMTLGTSVPVPSINQHSTTATGRIPSAIINNCITPNSNRLPQEPSTDHLRSPPQPQVPAFARFWRSESCRDAVLSELPSSDLASLRLVCHDFSACAAPMLFEELTITFRPGTFTRPARMAALERIGRHVRTLTFCMPHSQETFLAPLLDPLTGEERTFIYQPQISCHDSHGLLTRAPKYGSWEMTDLLVQQYGPLFHAATNVPAFIRALTAMQCITHLKISCPGQDPAQRYRRSAVDYALTSLRIAVERAPLKKLSTLSLLPIHPGGIFYLSPTSGFGASPCGVRRWSQVRKLAMHVDAWAFDDSSVRTDHLKLLREFLSTFSAQLERFFFRWRGMKGPCPFTLDAQHPFPKEGSRKHQRRIRFRRLRYFELANVRVAASEVCSTINRHRRTLRECDFDEVELRRGSWDDALSVLTRISGSDRWKDEQVESEVPLRDSTCGSSDGETPKEEYFGSREHLRTILRNSTVLAS